MDSNVKSVLIKRIDMVIDSLKKNNMNGHFVESTDALFALLDDMVKDQQTVTVGGSMTLFETGTIDYLRSRNVEFWDRYAPGLNGDDIKKLYRQSFSSNFYFASTNAITEQGELYNVDGNGNRVAAMIYGPDQVILIVGANKIVKDIPAAIERNRKIAAPANVVRLNRKTPCATTGYCTDCDSPEKVCHAHSVISSQVDTNRIHVIFMLNDFGY